MPASKNISVLFIEDSRHDAELAQLALERSGYTLQTELVYNHAGVVEALQRRRFDLILADFILPGFSGSQALQEARRLAPQTPFIFLSGVFGEEHAVNMMRSGAVDYVLKQNLGFLPKAVERALGEVNERRRRLQAEQALREVEVRARLAIDAARLGMWDYEPQSGTLIWDERCRSMLGLDTEAPVSMGLFEQLLHPEDRERIHDEVIRAISGEDAGEFCTCYRVVFGDGSIRWMETRGQAFFESGQCTRFVGVVMDITEQQLTTQSLRQINETLGERVEERTRERGATLTGQLLAFARRQQLAPTAIDLNDTLVSLLSLLKSTLGGSVSIETDTQAHIWHALVDPTQIEMIILNLAINARDAMGDGGRLTLGTRNVVVTEPALRAEDPAPGEYVVLSVTDTGTGMSEEVLSKAFEPFFTTKEVGKGSGLGLAQVFGFAKQSGGGARIESRVGVGTTVKVFLPRTAAPEQPEQATALSAGSHDENSQHSILLVDDDHSVREVTAQMLENLGFAVTEAESGYHALQLLRDGAAVDLLLADFAMPGMNGGELARAVRVRRPQLPVVFVTGYAELCELGLDGYSIIQKPFREEQLANKIHLALREGSLADG